jgi:hypothetical protein
VTETQIRQAAAEARQTTLRQFFSAREASRAIGAAQDKTMLSLSGGALVFSMTLVGSFAPARLLLPILVLSWIAFAISMVAVVFGIRAEQLAIHQDLQETAQVLLQIDQGKLPLSPLMANSDWNTLSAKTFACRC